VSGTPGPSLNDFIISRIRTAVPLVVGVIVTATENRYDWLPKIDGQSLAPAAVFLVSYGYYGLVRWLEHWKPALGWLLGYPAQPTYGGSK
jgi:hypothetical protein